MYPMDFPRAYPSLDDNHCDAAYMRLDETEHKSSIALSTINQSQLKTKKYDSPLEGIGLPSPKQPQIRSEAAYTQEKNSKEAAHDTCTSHEKNLNQELKCNEKLKVSYTFNHRPKRNTQSCGTSCKKCCTYCPPKTYLPALCCSAILVTPLLVYLIRTQIELDNLANQKSYCSSDSPLNGTHMVTEKKWHTDLSYGNNFVAKSRTFCPTDLSDNDVITCIAPSNRPLTTCIETNLDQTDDCQPFGDDCRRKQQNMAAHSLQKLQRRINSKNALVRATKIKETAHKKRR